MEKYRCSKEKVPFYFRYFGRLIDKGVEKVHAKDVAKELGFKSANSIFRDFNSFIDGAGSIAYGYNNVFMYNNFKKLMDMEKPVKVAVVGKDIPLFHSDECEKRGFNIVGSMEKIDSELIHEHEIKILILNKEDALEFLSDIPKEVEVVINMTGYEIDGSVLPFHIVNVDILELLANAWYSRNIGE